MAHWVKQHFDNESESESVSVSVSVGASPLQADPAFTLYRQGMRTPRVSSLTAD